MPLCFPGKIHLATNCEAIESSCQRYFHILAIDSSAAPPPVSGHKLSRRYHPCPSKYARGAEIRLTTVLSKVLLTRHATRRTPHGASRLLDATFAWSVKIRPAPFRTRRDASVYGPMTTGMHDNESPPSKLRQFHLDGIRSNTWCSRPRPSTSGLTSSRAPTETYRLGRWKLTR